MTKSKENRHWIVKKASSVIFMQKNVLLCQAFFDIIDIMEIKENNI